MLEGFATANGTAALAARFAERFAGDFYGPAGGLTVSSLGIGTYLGEPDAETDAGYEAAIRAAVAAGVNHIDTAVNYRSQASERAVGRALAAVVSQGLAGREELLVATKGGFNPQDRDDPQRGGGSLLAGVPDDEVAGGVHCIHPRYLERMLARSLDNLQLEVIDLYYLHNPEFQLDKVSKPLFYQRLRGAFTALEAARERGEIRVYGTATWDGYRAPLDDRQALELERVVEVARSVGGDDHGFRAIQLPVSLRLPDALTTPTQRVNGEELPVLEAARRLGITAFGSGSLAQGDVLTGMPSAAGELGGPGLTAAARALLFARASGVATALVGMSQVAHVRENLQAGQEPKPARDALLAAAGKPS